MHIAVAGVELGFNRKDFAQKTFVIRFFDSEHVAVPSAVLVGCEEHACFLAGCFHLIELLYVERCRLLGYNVLAGFCSLDAHLLVQVIGNGQNNCVYFGIREKLICALIELVAHLDGFLLLLLLDIAHCNDLYAGSGRVLRMPFAHSSESDNA